MEEKLYKQIIKKVTGTIGELVTVATVDKTEILFSSNGYGHFLDYGTLLYLEELVATTLDYYKRSNITDDDINNLNLILSFENSNGFSVYDDYYQDRKSGPIKKMKKGLRTKIYVIRDSNSASIKVGKSINPKNRLRGHQVSNPNKLELIYEFKGYERDEKLIHIKLKEAGLFIHGEWFKDCKESLDIVRKHFEV